MKINFFWILESPQKSEVYPISKNQTSYLSPNLSLNRDFRPQKLCGCLTSTSAKL